MKLKIKKLTLLEGLNKVSKALSTKNLIPVLSGIKFELHKDKLILTASDNDITIQTFIKLDDKNNMTIEKQGSIIIQGKYILDIVRKLPDEYINIEVVDELKILIYTDNSEFTLNGINEKEYPNINLEKSKNPIKLDQKIFKDIVTQTAFASSTDEAKPVLTGINFNISGNILECNSTDSYRLARKIVNLKELVGENYNIVIPSKNIIEFSRIMGDGDTMINMHIFNNKILFEYDNILFQSRLINGTYPNTSNLIPTDSYLTLVVDLDEFYSVIDRASILTSDREKNIVTLQTDNNKLTIKSYSAEVGRVEEKLIVENKNNENIKISFSARYMMEALKSFNSDKVEIKFVGEIKPIVLKDSNDDSLTQLVLPIRTY